MGVRHGLLALLDEGPAYGYQLKASFEERTGGTWPLNIGQVYTTLARAERDGLVTQQDADDDGRVVYELTAEGRAEVARWFDEPVRRDVAPRDELTIKLALAVTAPGVDVGALVQRQRSETMRTLQSLTRLKVDADDAHGETDTAWLLVLERLIFDAEAEARWLDHVEARLRRAADTARAGTPGSAHGTEAGPAPGSGTATDTARAGTPGAAHDAGSGTGPGTATDTGSDTGPGTATDTGPATGSDADIAAARTERGTAR